MARLRITNVLKRWWANVAQRPATLRVQVISSMSELPLALGNRLYIVGKSRSYKWVIFSCPCGCGDRIDVCLMPSAMPRWELSLRKGRASLSPSVWVPRERCGSHFWIRQNRVIWCDK